MHWLTRNISYINATDINDELFFRITEGFIRTFWWFWQFLTYQNSWKRFLVWQRPVWNFVQDTFPICNIFTYFGCRDALFRSISSNFGLLWWILDRFNACGTWKLFSQSCCEEDVTYKSIDSISGTFSFQSWKIGLVRDMVENTNGAKFILRKNICS